MERYLDLTYFYSLQAKLDQEIASKHHVSYETTRVKRTLALYVEIGELANASRCFKYWSNKESESKERLLDEYADGLHFILSLGIDIKIENKIFKLMDLKLEPSTIFIKLYSSIASFSKTYSYIDYKEVIENFLSLSFAFNFSSEDIFKAYLKKLNVNYIRQENNY